jgi:hypothetical protein
MVGEETEHENFLLEFIKSCLQSHSDYLLTEGLSSPVASVSLAKHGTQQRRCGHICLVTGILA